MKEGKLFFLLKHLTPEEFKGFRKAIRAPFFNGTERLLTLYEALRPHYPDYTDSEKYRLKLYKKVFPKEAFNSEKQHQLFSAFCRIVEEYMLILHNRSNKLERRKQKIRLYAERQMKPYFDKETKALAAELEASPHRDLEHYETQIFLHNLIYFNPSHNKYDLKDTSLDNLVDALDHHFVLAKMRYGISVKSRERILAKPGMWRFTTAMKEETGFMNQSILFHIYMLAFSMLNEAENFDFEAYEKLLFTHIEEFRTDSQMLFFAGLNYVNKMVNRGRSEYSRKAFDWFRFGLDKEFLFQNGLLTDASFSNIVICGCREKEFEWAQNFINDYAKYLDGNRREEVISYNQGMWHFYKKEYENLYTLWLDYPFSYEYEVRSRQITLRAVFELFLLNQADYKLLISNIKAFEGFIYRDKKYTDLRWNPTLNYIRILKKIATMLMNQKPKREISGWIDNQIYSDKKIVGKAWLKEKSQQIGQDKKSHPI